MNIIEQQRSRAEIRWACQEIALRPITLTLMGMGAIYRLLFHHGSRDIYSFGPSRKLAIFGIIPRRGWESSATGRKDHFQMYYLWVINRVEVPGYLRFCSTNRDGDKWPNIFFFASFFDSLHQTLKREKIQYKFCVCNVCLCNSKVVGLVLWDIFS